MSFVAKIIIVCTFIHMKGNYSTCCSKTKYGEKGILTSFYSPSLPVQII